MAVPLAMPVSVPVPTAAGLRCVFLLQGKRRVRRANVGPLRTQASAPVHQRSRAGGAGGQLTSGQDAGQSAGSVKFQKSAKALSHWSARTPCGAACLSGCLRRQQGVGRLRLGAPWSGWPQGRPAGTAR